MVGKMFFHDNNIMWDYLMDLMQNYPKLFKIINFKGAGGPMFKTCLCAPYIAVMTISEFEPHSRFHS